MTVLPCGRCGIQALALGLILPRHYFAPITGDSYWGFRLLGYPSVDQVSSQLASLPPGAAHAQLTADSIGCGKHCDYGTAVPMTCH